MTKKSKRDIDKLIEGCCKQNPKAQFQLFQCFGPKMKAVCYRYLFDSNKCGEILNAAFLKVFDKIEKYEGRGSFEGWIRKIVVNECLDENKKKHQYFDNFEEGLVEFQAIDPISEREGVEEILRIIEKLPKGYRLIFNLYEIEGYDHKEIAEKLGISITTSRSQLTRAKKILREKIKNIEEI